MEITKVACNKESCTCNHCVRACKYKPGWFKPGEIEKVAEFMKLSVKELFDQYLTVDWYVDAHADTGDIFLIAPATIHNRAGGMMPYDPTGTCVFLKDNRCSIHPVKPFECRDSTADENIHLITRPRHREVGGSWLGSKQPEELLGYKPNAPEPKSFAEMCGMFF